MKIPGKHLRLKNLIRNIDTEDTLHLDGSQPISTLLFLLFRFFVVLSFILENIIISARFMDITTNIGLRIFKNHGRSRPTELFLGKGVLKMCNKFTEKYQCWSMILPLKCDFNKQSNFIEIVLPHRCSPVNLSPIFKSPFYKNTSRELLLSGEKSVLRIT